MKAVLVSLALSLLPLTSNLYSTGNYKIDPASSEIEINGTSTLHDWQMIAQDIDGSLNADLSGSSFNISGLTLKIKAESLKSGKSAMDNNAYDALKTDKYPYITYKLTELKNISGGAEKSATAVGELSIAGKTKRISVPVKVVANSQSVNVSGITSFDMSSFGVEPPSFMFGRVNTGDEVSVKFDLNFKR